MSVSGLRSELNYWVIIPAAGIGSRMQVDKPKQYLKIDNKTILEHTLDCFCHHSAIKEIFVAISNNDNYWDSLTINSDIPVNRIEGGQERCHSVFNALLHILPIANDNDWVLVHDAARPCLRQQDLDLMLSSLADDKVGGILAVPVKDTMKRADEHGRISMTVDRNELWHAQTPQMFRVGLLFRSIKSALENNQLITDEASAIELAGEQPALIEGHADNIKITQPEDLYQAQLFLKRQGRLV